jgi:hypothetical protein
MDARYTEPMADDVPKRPDVVLLQGPTDDGEGIRVLRARDDRLEAGEVRPLKDGRPLAAGEVVRLAPRESMPRVCDVEVMTTVGAPPPGKPAQVATSAYRASWDRIFGGPSKPDERALN